MHVAQKVLAANMFIPPPMASSVMAAALLAVWLPIQSSAPLRHHAEGDRGAAAVAFTEFADREIGKNSAERREHNDREIRSGSPEAALVDSEMADLREVVKKPGMVKINRKALAEICEEKSPRGWRLENFRPWRGMSRCCCGNCERFSGFGLL